MPDSVDYGALDGDELVNVLSTLASPHRMRVLAALGDGRQYVSELARDLGISRGLLQVHLRKLERAGLVWSETEVAADGKAMKFYHATPFQLVLTSEVLARAASTFGRRANGRNTSK